MNSLGVRLLRARTRVRWLGNNCVDALTGAPQRITCPICQFDGPASQFTEFRGRCIFGGGPLLRHQCPDCDVIFGTRRMLQMEARALGKEYSDLYKTYSEGDSTESEMEAFLALEPVKGRRYLNYGCGAWSSSIEKLREDGYDLYGYEPFAQAEEASPSYILTRPEQLQEGYFDGVMSHNFLEHVQDPVSFLVETKRLLGPGGKMLHATPCYEYEYEFTRFHLFFFLGRSVQVIADRSGLVAGDLLRLPDGQLAHRFE